MCCRLPAVFFLSVFLGLFAGLGPGSAQESRPLKTPNILWLVAEDFSPHLGCYGTREVWTPNLDQLAAQGARYTRCFATAPVCSASRSALMTGMYQTTIGAHHHRSHRGDGYTLPEGVRILPDWLRQAGYFTANIRHFPEGVDVQGTGKNDWNFDPGPHPWDSDRWSDLKDHQPFYAQVNFRQTHRPFNAPRRANPYRVEIPPYYPDHPITRADWAAYLDAASELDRQVGKVLEQLEADGLADSTVVIFLSDHGQAHVRGKQWCYDSGLRIPLLIRWPSGFPEPHGYDAGSVDGRILESLDVSATTLAIAGADRPQKMQGRVFLGDDADPPRTYAFGARDRCDETLDRIRTVRDARYRYIRNFMPERPYTQTNRYKETHYPVLALMKQLHAEGKLNKVQAALMAPEKPVEELYDLESDPHETNNLADSPEHQEVLKRLRKALQEWLQATETGGIERPPVIPVGLDAYRQWERWPYLRIGARAYMRSTYDRRGGNEGADASHFLYQQPDDFHVTLDVQGPGVLYFARYNHWHGSPWHYEVDGRDHIVQESSTATPNEPVEPSVFLPESLFPRPLAWTWSTTRGADLMWVPIAFQQSFRMAYSRTHYGTGYYIYHQYVPDAELSQPIRAWDGQTPPAQDVLDLLARAGTDLAPRPGTPEGDAAGVWQQSGTVDLARGATVEMAHLTRAPSMLRALEFSVPQAQAVRFGRCRLRVTWDDRPYASIDAPIALLFGTGTLYNRDQRRYLVKGFPIHVRFDRGRAQLACYFPMPYFRSARMELVGTEDGEVTDIQWSLRAVPYRDPIEHVAYFHATYVDHAHPQPGKDLVLLDTRHTEGGGDWSGHLVGTSLIFTDRANLTTLEGDPRFFFDDSLTPQAQGTGTEEWGGGGDYWGGRTMTLPLAGHPVGARRPDLAQSDEDLIHSEYRFLLADLMPFGKNARICLEHGGTNQSTEHYQTVTYWYGTPSPSLILSDSLDIGDPASERAHAYHSPDASEPYTITSRYEWGIDTLDGREIYPAHTDQGRVTQGASEFTLTLEPDNWGVLLRRKLDYAYPDQRAWVEVAEASDGEQGDELQWQPAGVWYLAGSNTCIYSNPRDELGPAQHEVQTSNRRFRDDEFLLPRKLTQGRTAIRVRVRFMPVDGPRMPGHPAAEQGWSEIHYKAYSFVMPAPPVPPPPDSPGEPAREDESAG